MRALLSPLVACVVVVTGLACVGVAAEVPVTVRLDVQHPGAAIAPDFSGLSFEVALVSPGPDGVHYFRPDNARLLALFHTLGITHLRIGGNTSDRDAKRLPSEADLDSLFAFAQAAGVKVIYCLRLHNGDAQEAARTAKHIMDHYAAQVDCFSIGQEPSAYPVGKVETRAPGERMGAAVEKFRYEDYRDEWKRFANEIIGAVPDVRLCGPSVHNNGTWARRFMTDFARSNHVTLITEHLYPGGAGGKVPSPEIGRARMLSNDFVHAYQKLYDSFVPMAESNALPYRLEEVNNYFNGGATNVSNTFASALWGLDFMHWWAAHGAAGVDFHTGDRVAAGSQMRPSRYTAFFTGTNGFVVRPLGYGIKAFALGSRGHSLPLNVSAHPGLNLSAYAVLAPDRTVFVTLINKQHGPGEAAASVRLDAGADCARGEVIFLAAPDGDIAAQTGVTLGGADIKADGTWSGTWTALDPSSAGLFTLRLPPATAAIVRLTGP
ncbi:MAG TPA: hypothetical protein VMU04_02150 [Candidatus Acidoferrum sp.]|nr:hypothetical protein [Candidatus Acidoferrum sp.]